MVFSLPPAGGSQLLPTFSEKVHVDWRNGVAAAEDSHNIPHRQLFKANVRLDGAAGVVAGQHGAGAGVCLEAGVDMRLVIVDIQGDGAEKAAVQSVGQRGFVDEASACNVDEAGARSEVGEAASVDGLAAARRSAQYHAVALPYEQLQARPELRFELALHGSRLALNVVVQNLHSKC
jgi:hypothetical protein